MRLLPQARVRIFNQKDTPFLLSFKPFYTLYCTSPLSEKDLLSRAVCTKISNHMERADYHRLTDQSLAGKELPADLCRHILESPEVELLPLLSAAFEVRKAASGRAVKLHIINNAQNGFCPEDCHYCAQAKSAQANIEEYPLKRKDEFLAEAKAAHENGAFRYCMVFAGRGPSLSRVEKLADLIREIKSLYPLEICVSAGLLDANKARILKEAGLDRLNHNLNTSERHYPEICSTHTFNDRLETLQAARQAGIQLCSGVIVGMGEETIDIIDAAKHLRKMKTESIPINFLMSIDGTEISRRVEKLPDLTPKYCLRVLCLFRFLNPRAEIRMAAGREIHLRDLQVLGLYPANSLFLQGYLNTRGSENVRTLRMIKDAGFEIESDQDLEKLLDEKSAPDGSGTSKQWMKDISDLRPAFNSTPRS